MTWVAIKITVCLYVALGCVCAYRWVDWSLSYYAFRSPRSQSPPTRLQRAAGPICLAALILTTWPLIAWKRWQVARALRRHRPDARRHNPESR